MTNERPSAGLLVDRSDHHKIAQAIYHVVTGKTEKLSRAFSENYRVTFADIEQLNSKCGQMCSQWHVLERNTNITIHHLNDNSQNFSSIERLAIYDKSQTSPVEGIVFEFNMLLALPGIEKPQPYKVVARIASAITLMKRMEDDLPPPRFLRWFTNGPIYMEVEYVDYVVARSILATLESWVNEVQTSTRGKVLSFAQRNSHWAPRLSEATLLVVSSVAAYASSSRFLSESSGVLALARFLVAAFVFVSASKYIGNWLGRAAESGVDRVQELSYISFNRGDERLIEEFQIKNRKRLWVAGLSLLAVTIHALSCNLLAAYLYDALSK